MAVNPVIAALNSVSKIPVGRESWCFGNLTFTAADTYVAGGFDIRAQIRKLFGASEVLAILFMGTSSDSTGTHTLTTSRVQARYDFTPGNFGATEAGVVKLYAIGRTDASTVIASEVELTTGDSVDGLNFSFKAICRGPGTTVDSTMGPG